MNRYDRLPTATKSLFLLIGLAPALYAGWREQSWGTGIAVFIGGFLLAMAARQIIGVVCAHQHTSSNGDIDRDAVNECYIWPFLFAGPGAACVVAWIVLEHFPRF